MARRHGGLCNAPSEDETWHENAVRHLDDQDRCYGLYCELCDRCNGAQERILVSGQASVFPEAKNCSITKNGLVEDLSYSQDKHAFLAGDSKNIPGGNRPKLG
jgi:hypothetical protein